MVEDEETIAVEVAPLLGPYMYAVRAREGEEPRWGTEWVSGSSKDRKRWAAARRRYEKDRADAEAVLDAPVEWPWWGGPRRLAWIPWSPGHWAEERAWDVQNAERSALLDRAEQRYRPVHEEILARVMVVLEEQERAERVAQELKERLAAVAHRGLWGWVWE